MIWISIPILLLAIAFRIYSSVRFYQLYRNGVIPVGGRISLAKLSRAKRYARTDEAKVQIRQYRRWYVLYLIFLYSAFAIFFVRVFRSAAPMLK